MILLPFRCLPLDFCNTIDILDGLEHVSVGVDYALVKIIFV